MSTIMEWAKKTVLFLGAILPSNYEIVLQDTIAGKIISIINGHVSGRCLNAPLTDYALKVISDERWKTTDYELNYWGKTTEGNILRSSTFFLKERDKLVGMICININISDYERISSEIMGLVGLNSQITTTVAENASQELNNSNHQLMENFAKSKHEVISNTISQCLKNKNNIPVSRLTQKEKLEVVKVLKDQGVFLLKGAISDVAVCLNCSEATVYRYLSKLTK